MLLTREEKKTGSSRRAAPRRGKKRKGAFYKHLLRRRNSEAAEEKAKRERERLSDERGVASPGREGEEERTTINVDVFLRPLGGRRNVCSGKCNHAVI